MNHEMSREKTSNHDKFMKYVRDTRGLDDALPNWGRRRRRRGGGRGGGRGGRRRGGRRGRGRGRERRVHVDKETCAA
jgi:hypothetical protein